MASSRTQKTLSPDGPSRRSTVVRVCTFSPGSVPTSSAAGSCAGTGSTWATHSCWAGSTASKTSEPERFAKAETRGTDRKSETPCCPSPGGCPRRLFPYGGDERQWAWPRIGSHRGCPTVRLAGDPDVPWRRPGGEGLRGIHADRRNHAHRTDHEIAGRLIACLARLPRRRHGSTLVDLGNRLQEGARLGLLHTG